MTVSNRDNKSRMFLWHKRIPRWQRKKHMLMKNILASGLFFCFVFGRRVLTLAWFPAPGMTSNKWYSTAGQIFGESRGWRVQEIKRVQVSAIHCKTDTLHNRKTHQSQVVNDYLLFLHWCFLFCLTFDYKLISSLSITETGAHVGTINQKNVMWRLLRLRRSQDPSRSSCIHCTSTLLRSLDSKRVIVLHSSCCCKSE